MQRSHGEHNLRNHIRNHCGLAKSFGELVEEDGRFEIAFPRYFAMICFRIRPSAVIHDITNGHALENGRAEVWKAEEVNRIDARLLQAINGSGWAFVTHAVVGGIYAMRRGCAGEREARSHGVEGAAKTCKLCASVGEACEGMRNIARITLFHFVCLMFASLFSIVT